MIWQGGFVPRPPCTFSSQGKFIMNLFSTIRCGAAVLILTTCVAQAEDKQRVSWVDLVDQSAQIYEDPYLDLNYDQIESLQNILTTRGKLGSATLSDAERKTLQDTLDAAISVLAEDGIDADWLIEQRWIVAERREKAATAGNPDLDGETVTLTGYSIPAPTSEDGTRITYLVPQRGMCSHMPPPNANQMIRARLTTDEWQPQSLHEPVRLTGVLKLKETDHAFPIVDGVVPMRASYVLEVTEIEQLKSFGAKRPTSGDWTKTQIENLPASKVSDTN